MSSHAQTAPHHNQEMQQCIQNCVECHRVCLETITHCLREGGKHAEAAHIGLMLDCAQICQTSADFMIRGSGLHALERHPIPIVAWRLHAALAAASHQAGEAGAARVALDRALELMDQIERSIDDERLRQRWSSWAEVREPRASAVPAGVRAAV